MKVSIKTLLAVIFVIIISFFSFNSNPISKMASTSKTLPNKQCIIIDAGHGGFDGGAVASDGTVEKDINLNISKKLSEMLKLSGYNVIMTRQTDTATDDVDSDIISERKKSDLKERLKIINDNPDAVFVSIHLNKFTTSTASGAQVFYSPNNKKSYDLGNAIQSTIISHVQKENTRTIKKGTKSTYLLYKAKIPSVIVECGFLSNAKELELLKNENYQCKITFAVFCGIQEFFNKEQ